MSRPIELNAVSEYALKLLQLEVVKKDISYGVFPFIFTVKEREAILYLIDNDMTHIRQRMAQLSGPYQGKVGS